MGYTWWLIKDTKYCGQPNPKRKQVKQDNEWELFLADGWFDSLIVLNQVKAIHAHLINMNVKLYPKHELENTNATHSPLNGAIHVHCPSWNLSSLPPPKLKQVPCFCFNTSDARPLSTTPIQTNNACAAGIFNDTLKKFHSKAMDMHFYWIKDRVAQGQCIIHQHRGTDNLTNYFIKHHSRPAQYHTSMQSHYLLSRSNIHTNVARVC